VKYNVITVEKKKLWDKPLECDNYKVDAQGNIHFFNYETASDPNKMHYKFVEKNVRSVAAYAWGMVHEV